jgi:ThiF family protein
VDFSSPPAQEVEEALQDVRPGRWRRLLEPEMAPGTSIQAVAGWRVTLPENSTRFPSVNHFLLFVDLAYPYSEMRVAVPGMKGIEWPHVEGEQLLCLDRTSPASSTRLRVEHALVAAHGLLNWDDVRAKSEFYREIRTYWQRRADHKGPVLYSLAAPTNASREVVFCDYNSDFLIADSPQQAIPWLKNAGGKFGHFRKTVIIGISQPLAPAEYPRTGAALLALAGSALDPFLSTGQCLPILLAFENESGRGFVGLTIQAPTRSEVNKGFRRQTVPSGRAARVFGAVPTRLCTAERVDREWVHGRDHGDAAGNVKDRSVAIIGCGALGSQIAMTLAQAGIGRLMLVDKDWIQPHNTSRHLLGAPFNRSPKAPALAFFIKSQLPTVKEVTEMPKAFEQLDPKELKAIAECDLIVCAGVERRGEAFIDVWRSQLDDPPPLVCTWSEEYALVGHAAMLTGQDRLRDGYAPNGNFRFVATTWPEGSGTIREAGCGNDFQPFGAVDLIPTVQMAARLCLDVLLGKATTSLRRTWFGDVDRIVGLGGQPNEYFEASNAFREYPWEGAAT